MIELLTTLRSMGFIQLLLAFVFLTAYALALSGLTGALGRKRAGAVALLSAIGFAAATQPWAHGVILIAFAVAVLGLFIASAWALSTLFGLAAEKAQPPTDNAAEPEMQEYAGAALTPSPPKGAHTL